LLTGCQTTEQRAVKKSLTSRELKAIQAGQKSVVLFRLTSTETRDQESLDYLKAVRWNIWNVSDWQNRQLLVKPKDSSRSLDWRVPSEELGRAGWRYLVLEPGRYFIKVKPDEGMAVAFPVYHVSIPPGPRPVYAGSFRFVPPEAVPRVSDGKPETHPGFEFESEPEFKFEGIFDERDLAQEAGKAWLLSLGRVVTSLAASNDLATALWPYSACRILTIEATNRPLHATKYVGHKAGVIVGAPLALTGLLLLSVGDVDPVFAVGGIGLLAAGVTVAYVGDLTVGSISRMNWAHHEAALKQEIMDFNLARHLTNSLLPTLSGTNSIGFNETNAAAGFVVRLDVYRTGLEPENYLAWNYTFEVQVYLSVMETASSTVIWEHGYVYCNKDLKREIVPFATFVKTADKASSLKAYKGQPGRQRVQKELEEAARRLSAKMADHFKAAGF
jgi:hypothetical protein